MAAIKWSIKNWRQRGTKVTLCGDRMIKVTAELIMFCVCRTWKRYRYEIFHIHWKRYESQRIFQYIWNQNQHQVALYVYMNMNMNIYIFIYTYKATWCWFWFHIYWKILWDSYRFQCIWNISYLYLFHVRQTQNMISSAVTLIILSTWWIWNNINLCTRKYILSKW